MEQDVDAAIEIATDRAREAQEDLAEKLVDSPELEPEARRVEQRAEDLHDLTVEARLEADRTDGSP